jgi:hypothetical protein
MIGVSESTQRLNAKVESGVRQSALDMNFIGSWTFDTLGATGNGTNTYWYIDYDFEPADPGMEDTHFGTYQTVAGATSAYDILVAQAGGGSEFAIMTADWNMSGKGIYDYNVADGKTEVTCPEPVSNMMSYKNSITDNNHVFQNEVYQGGVKVASVDVNKDTWIYGGYDMANGYYTNRGFGFVTFGKLLDDGDMENYQKCMNRFETSMSRNIY